MCYVPGQQHVKALHLDALRRQELASAKGAQCPVSCQPGQFLTRSCTKRFMLRQPPKEIDLSHRRAVSTKVPDTGREATIAKNRAVSKYANNGI
jgi:hypothetical protein